MKIKNTIILLLSIVISFSFYKKMTTPIKFIVPKNWPKPQYDFSKNELTEEGFQLGRHLFYDTILSRNNTISCASCHLQISGFTHIDHNLSHGIDDKIGTRNSIALINLAWSKNFMWDGGVNHIEVQPLAPITSPLEMDENLEHIKQKLQTSKKYNTLFFEAYGDSKITGQRILKALSQFMLLLQSSNSKYDKVMRKETSFTPQELNGYKLFKNNCASCHKEPLFTNNAYENNGLSIDSTLNDIGRMKITQNVKDSLKFKVPTLRNIQVTFPYMHDGRFSSLTEVIKHYNSFDKNNLHSKKLNKIKLSDKERVDLIVFLKTLTDSDFLKNSRFSYPK